MAICGKGGRRGWSPAAPSRKNKPRWPSRREERLGSRHLRVVQRHLLFLPYNPYDIRYLRGLPPSSRMPHVSHTHPHTHNLRRASRRVYMCTRGYNTTRNPRARAARDLFPLCLLLSLCGSRGLFSATGGNVYICLLRRSFAGRASHKERFIVWRPPGAMDAERIPPSSRRVAAGDKTPTKPALLITVGVTGPICIRTGAEPSFPNLSQKGGEKNPRRVGHREWSSRSSFAATRGNFFRCGPAEATQRRERSLCCCGRYLVSRHALDVCSVVLEDFSTC